MSTVRLRRLEADNKRLREYVTDHPRLEILQEDGDPPERYQVQYSIKSLRQIDDEIRLVKTHQVEIALPRNYPRMPPQCRMLTPVFHPNIAPHAICIGDHWNAGEPLWSIVARIGEMLAYQSYNTKSPLNGEAAKWVDDHADNLPLDTVSMLLDTKVPNTSASDAGTRGQSVKRIRADVATPSGTPEATADLLRITCDTCGKRYKVPSHLKRVRCRECRAIIAVGTDS